MRVTEFQLINLAADAVNKGREKFADASEVSASGVRVNRPSQDVIAWTEGARTQARMTMSTARESAIGRSHDRLIELDRALTASSNGLQRAVELAVQLANGIYGADNRASAAIEISEIRKTMIDAANVQSSDGEHLFAGAQADVPPFDASGAFKGDASVRQIETGEQAQQLVTVSGQVFTSANGGVDVFGTLQSLVTALQANDPNAVRATIGNLNSAVSQIAEARGLVGTRQQALEMADDSRRDLETNLQSIKARTTDADAISSASDLARSKMALETAQATAQQILSALKQF